MKAGQHIISLSLGNMAEPGAVVAIDPRTDFERSENEDGEWNWDWENFYTVDGLQRFPAGHSYSAVATRISQIMSDKRLAKNCHLLLDITSAGAAPVRVFERQGHYATVIELTNSGSKEFSDGVSRAPLRDVIGAAQVVVQTDRLKVVSKLEHASTLGSDLLAYDPKPMTRGLDLRGGRNSDLVHALAVALWWADTLTWGDWPRTEQRPLGGRGSGGWMGN
jgi:hypothetical protein